MKQKLPGMGPRMRATGAPGLLIGLGAIARVTELPLHHSDPFDRLIIAQALIGGLAVVTSDRRFEEYGVKVIW